jgi:hypothetical protein
MVKHRDKSAETIIAKKTAALGLCNVAAHF